MTNTQQEIETTTGYLSLAMRLGTGVVLGLGSLAAFLFFTEKRGALAVDNAGNTIINTKQDLYNSTIENTSFKSTMLQKLNPARKFLELSERTDPLKKGQYDAQVVREVLNKNFSDLDQCSFAQVLDWHNIAKATVLTVVPWMQGLEAAPDVNLAGQDL